MTKNGAPQLMTPPGNKNTSVGTGGSLNNSFLAHVDPSAGEKFRIRIENGGAADYKNLPVIPGYIGLNADFDLNAFFDSIAVSLPDVAMTVSFGGANAYNPNSSSDGAYSQIAARFAHTPTRLGRMSIRTDSENNLVGNRLVQYCQKPSLESQIINRLAIDEEWEHPNGNPSTFNHVIEDSELLFVAEQQALVLETLKAGTYIEFEFTVPFYAQSAWYDPNNQG